MLNKSIEVKNEKPLLFQVSLLNNNAAQEVEVQEADMLISWEFKNTWNMAEQFL